MSAPISSYTPTVYSDGSQGNTPIDSANLNKTEQGVANAYVFTNSMVWKATNIKTAAYTPNYTELVRYDCTTGGFTSVLPAAYSGALILVKKYDNTGNIATFTPAGSDVIDNGLVSMTLRRPNESKILLGITGGWVLLSDAYAMPQPFSCSAQLGADQTGLTASTYVWGLSGWAIVPNADPFSMFSTDTTSAKITIPQAGRYYIWQHSGITGASGIAATNKILLNPVSTTAATAVAAASIGSSIDNDAGLATSATEGVQLDAFSDQIFAAGDVIRWAAMGSLTWNWKSTMNTSVRSKIVCRYISAN